MGRDEADTVWAPRPSEVLSGRYHLLEEIGRGGMGIVYRARDLLLGTPVAVKVLSSVLAQDPASTERLKEEARVAHRLGHPNIVQLRNFEEDGPAKFLVMELVEGTSLRGILAQRGPLPLEYVLELAEGMCAGLGYAHSQRVVHRDLKPENFLVGANGVVKIADFGLAKVARDLLGPVTQVLLAGTPIYMSPEQFRGDKVDARADIYSLGMTLYEMLSGPDGVGPKELHVLALQDAVPDIPHAPPHVSHALRRALSREPAGRWETAGELLQALRTPVVEVRAAAPLTSFFGRERELGRLEAMVLEERRRLITLAGPGGCGKTRLAQEACGRLLQAFGGAVWFVPLQDVAVPHLIADAVVAAMGLKRAPAQTALDLLKDAFSDGPNLLVLDNFEHLVDSGAAVVRQLLQNAPELVCLVTSRQLLRLTGERRLDVGPLPVPLVEATAEEVRDSPSVRMFVDRARAVQPDFQLAEANASAVGEVCRRLDGIPLAIELAAARSQVMGPTQILESLERPLDFLVSRTRDVAERHRTLRAAIEWSCRQLSPVQQAFFVGLSVFRGGWTAGAARTVCEDALALDHLAHLCECSLVLADDSGTEVRFRMLDTLRAYAQEQLSAEGQVELRRRHARHYLSVAEQASGAPEQEADAWDARFSQEKENMRTAMAYFVTSDGCASEALRLAAALGSYWLEQGLWHEGRESLCRALANSDPVDRRTPVRALALSHAAGLASGQGDYEDARERFEEALDIFRELGDMKQIAAVCGYLGNVRWRMGDCPGAKGLHEEALAIWRQLGDEAGIAAAMHNLGLVAAAESDYDRSGELLKQSLGMRRDLGDDQGVAESMSDLGINALDLGDYETAHELLAGSLSIRRGLGQTDEVAVALHNLGILANARADYSEAERRLRDSMALSRKLGHKALIVESLAGMAAVRRQTGDPDGAARLLGASEALREQTHATEDDLGREKRSAEMAALRGALGDERFEQAWHAGRAMTLEAAVDLALRPHSQ